MESAPGINKLLTPVDFTRYGPRHDVVASRTIPSPHRLFALSHIFFRIERFLSHSCVLSPHPCSPVYSWGAPLESVLSPSLPSRPVKLVEDLPMILVVYIHLFTRHISYLPSYFPHLPSFSRIVFAPSMSSLLLFPGKSYSRSRLIRPVPRVHRRVPRRTPDWRWRLNQFTSALDYLRYPKMSEADDRKAKAARAKALVCTFLLPTQSLRCFLINRVKQLKKRQQATKSEKSPPPSRTFTPLPQDNPPADSPTIQADDTQNAADMQVPTPFTESPQQRCNSPRTELVCLKI